MLALCRREPTPPSSPLGLGEGRTAADGGMGTKEQEGPNCCPLGWCRRRPLPATLGRGN